MRRSAPTVLAERGRAALRRRAAYRVSVGLALCAAFGSSPGPAAAQPSILYAYVANSLDGTVSVINTTDDLPAATIPVGTNPFGAVATPDGKHVYVTDDSGVQVIDTATNTVTATIPGIGGPNLAFDPTGSTAYLVERDYGAVAVIDTATERVVSTISLAGIRGFAWDIAISPSGKRAYVTFTNGHLAIIDLATGRIVKSVTVPFYAGGIAVSPDGSRLYLADVPGAGGDLSILNAKSGAVLATVPVGPGPIDVALSADGRRAYVADAAVNMLTEVDTKTDKVTATWATSSGGWSVAVAAGSVYVTDYDSASASVATPGLDEATSFGVGNGPAGIALAAVSR
jgi:YVTN family beta-propeller protein